MCADCHSTNVEKNFDVNNNRYNTTFSEISIGCEACHGPASEHIKLVDEQLLNNKLLNKKSPKKTLVGKPESHYGFDRTLAKSVEQWLFKQGETTRMPKAINPSSQTLVCAQCHSRHVQISQDDYIKTGHFGDRYRLNLIDGDHYYPDGQFYDENYVYGSFLQSKMNDNGVMCSNCHNPHTAKLSIPKESVCLQCHQAQTYANEKHHHHPLDSVGAQCVSCHMPATTYMQVDSRRDHQWHVPRPDYGHKLGTPDVCLSCHTDKDSHWSDKVTNDWKPGSKVIDEQQYAPVFSAADQGYQGAASALSHIAKNDNHADIIRASALERLAPYADTNSLIATARGAKHSSEYVRLGAIRGAVNISKNERWRILSPLLGDPVLAVRTEAVAALMPLWQELSTSQQIQLQEPLQEYNDVQTFNADRGFSHTNRANMFVHQGNFAAAEKAYQQSIRIEPGFDAAHIYLAELLRRQGKESASKKQLLAGETLNPDNDEFSYHLGLSEIRMKNPQKAIEYFRKATRIEAENAQYHYVLGLALETGQPKAAVASVRQAFSLSQNPQYLYAMCEIMLRNTLPNATQCLKALSILVPEDVVKSLQSQY